jgi:UDP:flavonoid glycosyltransferase YjiC (YdhE family)
MRLLILSIGSRGDVQPYVSLARALKAAGYDVAVGVAPGYREFVESHGVEHRSFDCGDPRELLANPETRNAIENGGNPLRFVRKLGEILGPLLEKGYIDACHAARDADAIIAGPGGVPVAQALEESRGLPYVPAFLQPSHPTREFASWLMPEIPRWLPFCGALRRASHHAAFELLFRVIRGANDSARRRVLDLGPGVNGFASMLREAKLTLYGYSEHVVPTPKDWGPNALATGYWFLPQLSSWQAPRALVDFLESGEKPVCIGFGSMTTNDPAGATQLVARSCKQARVRAVLLTGWGGLEGADLGDGVFALDAAPHDWLFPRMAGVVHHGGAGTTSAAMRAGVPSFAATFIADQQFWGRRIVSLGCGPGPIAFRKLGVDELARRIRALVDTPAYRDGAIEIGRKLRGENGAARAAAALRI